MRVSVEQGDTTLRVSIRDDGVGGADLRAGSGLIGLRDRAEAIGGTIWVESPVGAGTTVRVCLPLTSRPGARLSTRRLASRTSAVQ